MKKINGLLVSLLFCLFCLGVPASAENGDKIVDRADLLTDAEEEKLEEQFAAFVEEYQIDLAVVTADSCDGKSPRDFADDFYEQNGYGCGEDQDGLLLLVSMEDRDWWITTWGEAISLFTDDGIQQLGERFVPSLSDGEYFDAFRAFARTAGEFVEQGREGEPYDMGNEYEEPMPISVAVVIAAAAGAVVALVLFLVLFVQLKSVNKKREAMDYVRAGSFQVTRANDLFLYRNVTVRKIEQAHSGGGGGGGSSTHTTSGGGTAGGGGGKF